MAKHIGGVILGKDGRIFWVTGPNWKNYTPSDRAMKLGAGFEITEPKGLTVRRMK